MNIMCSSSVCSLLLPTHPHHVCVCVPCYVCAVCVPACSPTTLSSAVCVCAAFLLPPPPTCLLLCYLTPPHPLPTKQAGMPYVYFYPFYHLPKPPPSSPPTCPILPIVLCVFPRGSGLLYLPMCLQPSNMAVACGNSLVSSSPTCVCVLAAAYPPPAVTPHLCVWHAPPMPCLCAWPCLFCTCLCAICVYEPSYPCP